MKKRIFTVIIGFIAVSFSFAVETVFRINPHYLISVAPASYTFMMETDVALDLIPFTLRGGRDLPYITFQANGFVLNAKSFSSTLFEGDIGLGYNFRLNDRTGIGGEGLFGFWYVPENKVADMKSMYNFSAGVRAFGEYYISPEFSAGVSAGYKILFDGKKYAPAVSAIEAGVYLRYNFNKGFVNTTDIALVETKTEPLFPVFYSRYDDNKFGEVTFVNGEVNDITNVTVSLFIEQFMSSPTVIAVYSVIKPQESFGADFKALLDETILNSMINLETSAKIIIEYHSIGKVLTYQETVPLTVLSRNSMTWEDDRSASAFVSAHDASAVKVARQAVSIVKKHMDPSVPQNIQYAAALFSMLKTYGINYVVDPASAFTDNIGTSSVDFLQFPYQTLLYHGGDCDDLSILNCSLFESLGIDSAFITIPGHIFIAFDSGLTEEQAKDKLLENSYIHEYNKVWIPLEITLTQNTFSLAWIYGMREWNNSGENAKILPIRECRNEYSAVAVADSSVQLIMPEQAAFIEEFKTNLSKIKNKLVN